MINYLLAFSGLIFGIMLGYIAPEELKDGKPYFLMFQKSIIALSVFMILRTIMHPAAAIFLSIIALLVLLFIKKDFSAVLFALIPLTLYFGIIHVFFTFLFGLPTGAMLVMKHSKDYENPKMTDLIKILIGSKYYFLFFATAILFEIAKIPFY